MINKQRNLLILAITCFAFLATWVYLGKQNEQRNQPPEEEYRYSWLAPLYETFQNRTERYRAINGKWGEDLETLFPEGYIEINNRAKQANEQLPLSEFELSVEILNENEANYTISYHSADGKRIVEDDGFPVKVGG
ncbi:MAG: hypothetical protein KDC26_02820 [Armatimonadetes bacterium]|nr:hypothetical protein [Armatimonadota bacterium]